MAECFFHTEKDSRLVTFYYRDRVEQEKRAAKFEQENKGSNVIVQMPRSDEVVYKSKIFYPTHWEKMNSKQIEKERRQRARNFFFWGLGNRGLLAQRDVTDARFIQNRLSETVTYSAVTGFLGIFLNRFMRSLDPPVFDLWIFRSPKFQPRHLRLGIVCCMVLSLFYKLHNDIVSSDTLFDISLRYMDKFEPESMISPNLQLDFASSIQFMSKDSKGSN